MNQYENRNPEWEKIGENLYRREPSDKIDIESLNDILMINHNGTYISQYEYNEMVFNSFNDTYDTLMQEELAAQKPLRKTLESSIKKAKTVLKDIFTLNDKEFKNKYFSSKSQKGQ